MVKKVYSEFFTNLAVAWFAGGVIAPLFGTEINKDKLPIMLAGILGSFLLLQFSAKILTGNRKIK